MFLLQEIIYLPSARVHTDCGVSCTVQIARKSLILVIQWLAQLKEHCLLCDILRMRPVLHG